MNHTIKRRLLTPEEGASTLEECAHVRMDQKTLASVSDDTEIIEAVNALVCLTKTAIIINWLRMVEDDAAYSARASSILAAFERLIFSQISAEARSSFPETVEQLIASTSELHEIMRSKEITKAEISRRMLRWCKSWLETMFTDELFIKKTSLMYVSGLAYIIHGAMSSLAEAVQSVLFEEQNIPANR